MKCGIRDCQAEATHSVAYRVEATLDVEKTGEIHKLIVVSQPFCETCVDLFLESVREEGMDEEMFTGITRGMPEAGYTALKEGLSVSKVDKDYRPPNTEFTPVKICWEPNCNKTAVVKLVIRLPIMLKGGTEALAYIEGAGMCKDCVPIHPTANDFNKDHLRLGLETINKHGSKYDLTRLEISVQPLEWQIPSAEVILKDVSQAATDRLKTNVESSIRKSHNARNN